jgi:hypothetical protein
METPRFKETRSDTIFEDYLYGHVVPKEHF